MRKRIRLARILLIFMLVSQVLALTPIRTQASSVVPNNPLESCEKMRYLMEEYADPNYFLGGPERAGVSEEEYDELRQVALEVTSDCDTQYEKIKAITEYVADRTYYDKHHYLGLSDWTYLNAYDVYKEKRTVCAGYANLVQALCYTIEIPCMQVLGTDHAYNGAYDDENKRWVLTDATWCSRNAYTTTQEWKYRGVDLTWFDITIDTLETYGTYNHEIYNLRGILYNSVYYTIYNRRGSGTEETYREYDNWRIQPTDFTGEVIKIPSEIEGIRTFCDSFENESKVRVLDLSESKGTSLYNYGFSDCTSLEQIIFPDTLETIGTALFNNCTSLKKVDLSNTKIQEIPQECFKNCTSLETVIFPATVTSMGDRVFVGCTNIKEVDFSNTRLEKLTGDVFEGCVKLEKVIFPSGLQSIDSYSFTDCDLIKELDFSHTKIEKIPSFCFEGLSNLEKISFPKTLKILEYRAFYNCENLVELDFSHTQLTEISDYYFELHKNLKKVLLPSTITMIGEHAFDRCYALEEIKLDHTKITRIADGTFSQCTSLANVTFPSTLEYIGVSAFYDTKIKEIDLYHTQVKTIERYAFQNIEELCSVKFPITIEVLGDFAFYSDSMEDIFVYLPEKSTFDKSPYMKTSFIWSWGKRVVLRLDADGNIIPQEVEKITPEDVTLSQKEYSYDGKVKRPTVIAKDSKGQVIAPSNYEVLYSGGCKNVGTYKVTIKFKGDYSGTKTFTFKINPVKTTVSKLTAGKKIIKVKIAKKTKQITGYEIQYATSKKFSNAKVKTIKSYKTTKSNLKNLKAKKKYYVRVRTYKVVNGIRYYSGWSKIKAIKTKK